MRPDSHPRLWRYINLLLTYLLTYLLWNDFRRYHDRSVDDRLRPPVAVDTWSVKTADDRRRPDDQSPTGTDALLEVAVKTGLNLVFGLLHQNLSFEWQLGCRSGSLCNDVLQTALDIVMTFEPLSLVDKRRLSPLAASSLADVTSFLRSIVLPQSCASDNGRRLAAELMLALATQRGSLSYLLEWIEMALCAAVRPETESSSDGVASEEPCPRMITHATFVAVLSQMKKAMVCSAAASLLFHVKVFCMLWTSDLYVKFQVTTIKSPETYIALLVFNIV